MLKNLTIRTRLLLAFGLISSLMLLAAIAGELGTRNILNAATQTMEGEVRLVQLATQLRVEALQLRRFEKDVFINVDSAEKVEEYRTKWERAFETARQVRSDAEKLAAGETHTALQSLDQELLAYATGFRTTADAIHSGAVKTTAQANEAMGQYKEAVHRIDERGVQIVEDANRDVGKMEGVMRSHQRSVMITLAVLTIVSLVFAVALTVVITKSIVVPVRSAVTLARSVADGKLGHDFNIRSRDEIAELLHELSRMDGKLCEIIGEVHSGSARVRAAAAELAENNDQLSQRTQEQASSLEQTAASIEEMTAAIKANAESATNATGLARGASQVAAAGGQVVTSAVSAMSAINESSRRISDIISVIDEIAFQTNLLALNAAVEAARAGEQGRGFAVVAGEVRNLAQRSAEAAKEIKQLIGDSVQKVRTGSDLVSKSGDQLRQIVDSVQGVTHVVEEIASANSQQAAGISQLNDAVAQLDQITQQNAAGTEEIAAASKMMYEQSEQLAATVGYFSVAGRAGKMTASASRPHAAGRPEMNEEPYQPRYGT